MNQEKIIEIILYTLLLSFIIWFLIGKDVMYVIEQRKLPYEHKLFLKRTVELLNSNSDNFTSVNKKGCNDYSFVYHRSKKICINKDGKIVIPFDIDPSFEYKKELKQYFDFIVNRDKKIK